MQPGEGLTKTFSIPISHLDFDYVEKCTDIKELEKIFVTLKIGEEGKYPELESFCEDKIKKLCPESRVLRKPTELKTIDQLDREQRDQLTEDFQTWLSEMQSAEENMSRSNPSEKGDGVTTKNYPIRSKHALPITQNTPVNKPEKRAVNKSCKPKDYNEWSKIADQLEKQMIIEEKEVEESKPVLKKELKTEKPLSKQFQNLTSKVDTTGLSQIEKERLAITEKEKGNEAFRAGDLDEADIYYCRSLTIEPNTAVYNNRGLIYMKQKKWEEAIRDFNIVIKREPSNVKALLRRSSCYSEIHNLQDAIIDCQKILKLSPNNKTAETLLAKVQEEHQKRSQPKLKDGRRMVITEVDSDDEVSDSEDFNDKVAQSNPTKAEEVQKRSKVHDDDSVISTAAPKEKDTTDAAFVDLKEKGNELFKELKYEEALTVYNELTKRWPSNPIGYRNKAACNLMLDNPENVINDCSIAIELDKTSHLSFYRRGKAYKTLKRYVESQRDLEEALRISPYHKQINDELNDVKLIIYEAKMCSEILDEDINADSCEHEASIGATMMEQIIDTTPVDVQRSSPMSGTWEFLENSDLPRCPESLLDELGTSVCIVDNNFRDSSSVPVGTIERLTTTQMSKHEFDKKLSSIKMNYEWQTMIQLLVDASPLNLVSLMGYNLDGYILEHIISSLVRYSSNPSHALFIRTVLEELVKVKRFCFVKLMVSDHTIAELEQLFGYLRRNCDNMAQLDFLRLNYV